MAVGFGVLQCFIALIHLAVIINPLFFFFLFSFFFRGGQKQSEAEPTGATSRQADKQV